MIWVAFFMIAFTDSNLLQLKSLFSFKYFHFFFDFFVYAFVFAILLICLFWIHFVYLSLSLVMHSGNRFYSPWNQAYRSTQIESFACLFSLFIHLKIFNSLLKNPTQHPIVFCHLSFLTWFLSFRYLGLASY